MVLLPFVCYLLMLPNAFVKALLTCFLFVLRVCLVEHMADHGGDF